MEGDGTMFAVIFEVRPHPDTGDNYLALAQELRPHLDDIEGFLSIERFASVQRPGWVLSLSCWRDEAALVRWRTFERHHQVQEEGRAKIFADYRIRVSQVIEDVEHGKVARPERRTAYNDATAHPATFVGILEVEPSQQSEEIVRLAEARYVSEGGGEVERFASIYTPGKTVMLSSWRDEEAATAWHDQFTQRLHGMQRGYRWRLTEVERDYGMFARQEAPQYYPPVATARDGAAGR